MTTTKTTYHVDGITCDSISELREYLEATTGKAHPVLNEYMGLVFDKNGTKVATFTVAR